MSADRLTDEQKFSGFRAWAAEGARIGIASCLRCGAAIVLDPADGVNMLELHAGWHQEADRG